MVGFSSLHLSHWPLQIFWSNIHLQYRVSSHVSWLYLFTERTCLEVVLSSFHWSVKFTIAESHLIPWLGCRVI